MNSTTPITSQSLFNCQQKSSTPSQEKSLSLNTKSNTTTFLPFLPSNIGKKEKPEILAISRKLLMRNPIDLSLAIITVKGKSLKILGVKKICNDYKLYY